MKKGQPMTKPSKKHLLAIIKMLYIDLITSEVYKEANEEVEKALKAYGIDKFC